MRFRLKTQSFGAFLSIVNDVSDSKSIRYEDVFSKVSTFEGALTKTTTTTTAFIHVTEQICNLQLNWPVGS